MGFPIFFRGEGGARSAGEARRFVLPRAGFDHQAAAELRGAGLAELAGAGIASADSFAGLRALLAAPEKRRNLVETAGRWSL